MNKAQLVRTLAQQTGQTQAQADQNVAALLEIITSTLAAGDDVALMGFGTFQCNKSAARKGRNPRTGEELMIPASIVPKFYAGATLKAAVNA